MKAAITFLMLSTLVVVNAQTATDTIPKQFISREASGLADAAIYDVSDILSHWQSPASIVILLDTNAVTHILSFKKTTLISDYLLFANISEPRRYLGGADRSDVLLRSSALHDDLVGMDVSTLKRGQPYYVYFFGCYIDGGYFVELR